MNRHQLLKQALRECLYRDRFIYIAIGIYCLCTLVGMLCLGPWGIGSFFVYFDKFVITFFLFMPCMTLAGELIFIVMRYDRRRRLAYRRFFTPHRIARLMAGLLLLMSISLFFGAFTWLKNMLPVLNGGFLHDKWQADLDRWLHGGVDPWRLLWSLPYAADALPVISYVYSVIWYVLCLGALFFVATSPKADRFRGRYIACFLFAWVFLGNILAGAWLSAGPAFYGLVMQDAQRFGLLVAALAGDHSRFAASGFQTYLWTLSNEGLSGFGSGISAFPSVHVGLVVMNALFVWDYSRRLGIAAFVFCAFIMASSVYLGWHYALDGYVSAVVMFMAHHAVRAFKRSSGSYFRLVRRPALLS